MIDDKFQVSYFDTMQSYHDYIVDYNKDKEIPNQIRNSPKGTGEHLIRIWMLTFQTKKTENFCFRTSLKSLATRMTKSESTIKRHIDLLENAKVIRQVSPSRMRQFTIEINKEIVKFQEIREKKLSTLPP